jgi:hypothetical protein
VVYEDYTYFIKEGEELRLDAFLPKYRVAFEYHGEQHFHDVYPFGAQRYYAERDRYKRIACHDHDITLIEIPYWWDFKQESLLATIFQHRSDMLATPVFGTPIPQYAPSVTPPSIHPCVKLSI